MYSCMYVLRIGYSQASIMNRLGSLFFIVINQVGFYTYHPYMQRIPYILTSLRHALLPVGVQQCDRSAELFPE
jgi:hypothetical protein